MSYQKRTSISASKSGPQKSLLTILLDAGFPTNSTWLSDGQRRLLEYIFDEYYKEIHHKLKQCCDYIEELEDEIEEIQKEEIDDKE